MLVATPLFEGHANRVADGLRQLAEAHPTVTETLRGEANYFDDNQRRMQYLELREDGFRIGSGMVESGCKQFRARFNGPGMRWSRPGIERLLPVRAAITPAHTAGDMRRGNTRTNENEAYSVASGWLRGRRTLVPRARTAG